MASVGDRNKNAKTDVETPDGVRLDPTGDGSNEKTVDYLKDAPEERPYDKAVTDEHREVLREQGVQVGKARKK